MSREAEIVEEELVYGARRREQLWQRLAFAGLSFGVLGCLSAAAVSILDVDPAPVVVPYDPETGLALPNASVGAVSVTENQAIIESVRRQSFWASWRPDLSEGLAHLVGLIMRRICGEASAAFRLSSV